MTLLDPWGHDGKTFDGKEMRLLVDAMFQTAGVVASDDFLVEQQTSPGPTVKVRAGSIIIPATAAGLFGKYHQANDASLDSPSFTATSANGRKDRLVVRITNGAAALEIVQGVASGSPAEPAITGDNYQELALVTLPGSTTNITTAMITDRRAYASSLAGANVWTAFTPTIGGTGWVKGNAVTNCSYLQQGKLVFAHYDIVWGSTSVFGSGPLTVTLPVTAVASKYSGQGFGILGASGTFDIMLRTTSTTVAVFGISGYTSQAMASVITNQPVPWASGYTIAADIVYQAA